MPARGFSIPTPRRSNGARKLPLMKRIMLSGYLKVIRATLHRWLWPRTGLCRPGIRGDDLDGLVSAGNSTGCDAWVKLSEASFARDWDNEMDAVYDNWRKHYGAPRSALRRHR